MVIMEVISKAIVIRKQIPAVCRDVNFNILMKPIIIQQQMISFTIKLLPLKNHPNVKPIPTKTLISSIILN